MASSPSKLVLLRSCKHALRIVVGYPYDLLRLVVQVQESGVMCDKEAQKKENTSTNLTGCARGLLRFASIGVIFIFDLQVQEKSGRVLSFSACDADQKSATSREELGLAETA